MPAILTITLNPALDVGFEVERMVVESKLRASAVTRHPGGGGINVARVATRLAGDVEGVWLGGGGNADTLAALLEEEHVRHHQVRIRDELRLSIHVEERATGAMYRFVLPGAATGEAEVDALAAYIASARDVQLVVLSGSLPPSVAVDTYAQLARGCSGVRVVLDTSGEPLARGLAGHVFLAKPNRNELGRMLGRQLGSVGDVVAAARELIDAGRVEVLAVSLADEGLVLVTADGAQHLRAPPVEMVSAVGAGDSTVAGIVVGLARGESLVDAARLGVAAGTAAVLTPGSDLCRREDVERLYPDVRSAEIR